MTDELLKSRSIVIVEVVVTQGTMLLASATRLQEAFPRVRLRVFALIRTMSQQEILQIEDIRTGTIQPRGERAVRTP
ncbi:MAG: hypothetical protein HZC55_02805 [Verrucomicrobia bacterium]|nr:hypothetical protein [Verrucomicrobiota bacterium]